MKKFITDNNVTVFYTQDITEWGHEFYNVPEDAELENREELELYPMGFAEIENKIVWIFIPPFPTSYNDILLTVAHELGHIVENGFKKNPPQKQRYFHKHEQKAVHYENFVKDAIEITKLIYDELCFRIK